MHLGPKEKVVVKLKKSRKAYAVEYFCGVFLFILLIVALVKGVRFPAVFIYVVVGISFFSTGIGEYSRQLTRYTITNLKIIISHGIIMQSRKNIYFQPLGFIPDLNIKQTRMQRLLNYGTVYLRGNNENAFEIRDVDNPESVLRIIEEWIEANREKLS